MVRGKEVGRKVDRLKNVLEMTRRAKRKRIADIRRKMRVRGNITN